MKRILVLGLGKFGTRVCQSLRERRGVRVFAFDLQEKAIERIAEAVHTAASGDLDDPDALKAFLEQIGEVDTAVVSLGDHVNTSILAALQLREAGVPRIVVKAVDSNHRRVLEAIDTGFPGERRFQVLIPELDAADRVARAVASDFVSGELPLGSGLSIMEVTCPKELSRASLRELELRSRYHLTVIGYRTSAARAAGAAETEAETEVEGQGKVDGESEGEGKGDLVFATPDTQLPEGGLIMVVGKQEDLEAFERKFSGG